jgi:hypothetical protein
MSRLVTELESQYWEPVAQGPVAQADLSALLGVPATILTTVTWTSPVIYADGFKSIAAAVTLTQAGTIQVLPFIDAAGTIPQTAPVATVLAANVSNVNNMTSGLPFQSFQVAIHNTSGSTATVSGFACLLNGT